MCELENSTIFIKMYWYKCSAYYTAFTFRDSTTATVEKSQAVLNNISILKNWFFHSRLSITLNCLFKLPYIRTEVRCWLSARSQASVNSLPLEQTSENFFFPLRCIGMFSFKDEPEENYRLGVTASWLFLN